MKYFKIHAVLESGHRHTWNTSQSSVIRTKEDLLAVATEVVGFQDGKPVTRFHWRDSTVGEFNSIVSATVEGPFEMTEADRLRANRISAIADAPPPKKEDE